MLPTLSKSRFPRSALSITWTRWRRRVLRFAAGGRWTDQLPPAIRHNMRALWLDGLFANTSEQILITYFSLYLLALGATRAQIGLMNSLSNLGAALVLFPGATLVERWGRRQRIVLLTGGGGARAVLMLMALVGLAFSGPAAVYIIIGLTVVRAAFIQLGVPAWMSLTSDIVPLTGRGRFFSSRNIAMGVAGMAITLLAGQMITGIGKVGGEANGYALAMGLSFVLGLVATFWYAQIREPDIPTPQQAETKDRQMSLLRHLRTQPDFLLFCGTSALWNFSLQIAGPFFTPYLAESLGANASIVGALSVVTSLASLPGQRLFGSLNDRWGARRVRLITGLIIPLLPWGWALTRSPWHVIPINLASGFFWAGFNLASFNFLLEIAPKDRLARYSALYQIVVMAAFAGGAALGGVVAERWGYITIFVLSGIGRLIAALVFAWSSRRPKQAKAGTP